VVYGGGTHAIDTVFCDGEPIVRDGAIETLNAGDELLERAAAAGADIAERTGVAGTRE
jgi:hypothetical protein